MKKRVVAYCRVSTDSKDQENSLENQQSYFQRELRKNEDYEYCGLYADKGTTGTTLTKRKRFNQMLIDAGLKDPKHEDYSIVSEPKFDLIVTKNTSRFARNVSVDVILKALAKNKVYVHFLDLDKTTEKSGDITYIQIFSTFDERDSRDKSEKVSFGMKEGAKNGKILCTNKIYGYKYYPNPDNRLEIIPEQAEVVKRIFEMYVNEGIGAYRIAKIFFKEGILNKSGKPFAECSIRGMLENEKYCGIVARMKYDTGTVFEKNSYAQIRPFEDRKEYQFEDAERMPAIISKEMFNRAQEIRKSRIQHTGQVGKKRKDKGINYGTTPYAGKIKCSSCGAQYRAFQTKQYRDRKERYYCCVGKLDINESSRCKNPNVSQTFLDHELRSENYSRLLAESFVAAHRFLLELKNDISSTLDVIVLDDEARFIPKGETENELIQLKAEHKKYQEQIEKAMKLAVFGSGSTEVAQKMIEDISKKDNKVVARLNVINKSIDEKIHDMMKIEETIDELKRRLGEIYDTEEHSLSICDEEGSDLGIYEVKEDIDGVYDMEWYRTPTKQFSQDEILNDIEHITITGSKDLIIRFKTFAEVEQLVERHQHIMTDRTLVIFEELKTRGWNRLYVHGLL